MDIVEAINILGLSNEYTYDDIDKAYKSLAKKYHPDKGGESSYMAQLNEARTLLHESKDNLPVLLQQMAMAITKSNALSAVQRNIERKVEKIEKDVQQSATNKLKRWRQYSLILAAIATAAFFLGKEIPTEVISMLQDEQIEKPYEIKEPNKTIVIRKYFDEIGKIKNKDKQADVLTTFSSIEQQEINEYLNNDRAYSQYLSRLAKYQIIQDTNKTITRYFYFFTFMFGIYASFIAWFFNQRIQRVENELSDLNNDLLIKSHYVNILSEIFTNSIQDDDVLDLSKDWTFKDLECAIEKFYSRSVPTHLIIDAIGAKKFTQLLIVKGQEMNFLKTSEGTNTNGYIETYSIV